MSEINIPGADRFELLKGESSYIDTKGNEIVILKREGNIVTWAIFKPEEQSAEPIRKTQVKYKVLFNNRVSEYFTDDSKRPYITYDLDNFKPITS